MKFVAKLKNLLVENITSEQITRSNELGFRRDMVELDDLHSIHQEYDTKWSTDEITNADWGKDFPELNCYWVQNDGFFNPNPKAPNEALYFLRMSHRGDKLVICKHTDDERNVSIYMAFSGSHCQLQEDMFKLRITSEAVEEVYLNEFNRFNLL